MLACAFCTNDHCFLGNIKICRLIVNLNFTETVPLISISCRQGRPRCERVLSGPHPPPTYPFTLERTLLPQPLSRPPCRPGPAVQGNPPGASRAKPPPRPNHPLHLLTSLEELRSRKLSYSDEISHLEYLTVLYK